MHLLRRGAQGSEVFEKRRPCSFESLAAPELAEGIRADADRQKTVIEAEAYRDAERTRGEGDAEASRIYAKAYNRDPEFYAFTRSLKAYTETFKQNDVLLLKPDSEFFRYMKDASGK